MRAGSQMPWQDNFYSRMVAWLKVLLPLAALALLSTLFLFSRNIDPTTTIPFTTIDLTERARDERITAPEFAGVTEQGHRIEFHAASAKPDLESPSRASAEVLDARIDLTSGAVITFQSKGGVIDDEADRATLTGDVVVQSSTGYEVHTDALISGMRAIFAETPGPITGTGPPGDFTAGRMLMTDMAETGAESDGEPAIHLLFTDGVKLLYDPAKPKE
ncbi:hypothetical protein RXV86_10575 [Alisedimentitalea sp. MJ-SS2]|uniref:LPS export ABC transporter periplasmic protein LptC n=1 Tax=Aliisedimentitalea sp. MJ-SS2 TaxID=3049795 RepID=UPI00290FB573|nr:LPS export ABC transporter periplasmic protein LptC [Alisedimentitalea sp. MJ-SS2]MDU8927828.1 hypothetical protein [Alisedimentitalea sp. MJ-SS2]